MVQRVKQKVNLTCKYCPRTLATDIKDGKRKVDCDCGAKYELIALGDEVRLITLEKPSDNKNTRR